MKTAIVNNDLTLSYPDGFREMKNDELIRHFSSAEDRWGIRDPKLHQIISAYKTGSKLFFVMKNVKTFAENACEALACSLDGYRMTGSFSTRVCGKKARGFSFEYTADSEVAQSGELVVFRHGMRFYALYYIVRTRDYSRLRYMFENCVNSIKAK